MICVLQTEEYSVVTGKGCGKMIETYITKFACFYGATIAISLTIIFTLCLVIRFNEHIQKSVTDRFGLNAFFKNDHFTQEIWFLIFVPVTNLVVSLLCVLAVFTDWGE